jgi:hypothetical protein
MPFYSGISTSPQEIKRLLQEAEDLEISLTEQRIINLHLQTMADEVFAEEDLES